MHITLLPLAHHVQEHGVPARVRRQLGVERRREDVALARGDADLPLTRRSPLALLLGRLEGLDVRRGVARRRRRDGRQGLAGRPRFRIAGALINTAGAASGKPSRGSSGRDLRAKVVAADRAVQAADQCLAARLLANTVVRQQDEAGARAVGRQAGTASRSAGNRPSRSLCGN